MATEEISEMDTLLEDDVEDVGEVELDDEEDLEPVVASSAVARRSGPEAEDPEGVAMRALAILTTLVMVLAVPVLMAISSGRVGSLASSIAGMFTSAGK